MNAARQTQSSGSMSLNKVDTLKDELEDASTRVEQCRVSTTSLCWCSHI